MAILRKVFLAKHKINNNPLLYQKSQNYTPAKILNIYMQKTY